METSIVNNFANINAAGGDGIRAYNYGIGDVFVNDLAGTINGVECRQFDARLTGSVSRH